MQRKNTRAVAPSATVTPDQPSQQATPSQTPDDPESLRRLIGGRVHSFRTARGLTIRSLATAASVTPGFISQVEHGQTMPSLTTLLRICRALEIDVGAVFGAVEPDGRVVRRTERRIFAYPDEGIRDEVLSADRTGRLEVLWSTIEAGCGSGDELYAHGTDVEFVCVVRGQIEIAVAGEWHRLEQGDSITFSGASPHGVRNPSRGSAEIIWAMTPAAY